MKPQITPAITATITAATIAFTSLAAAPANALTDEERVFLLITGAAAYAILTSARSPATPAPTPAPVTLSTGPITLLQTRTANFDNGRVGGPGGDLWFHATDAWHRYLKPVNGAKMAVGDRSSRGFAGCSAAHFTTNRVRLGNLPVGSYVCMKTNAGRISQFRVNRITGGIIKTAHLGYTTWR